MMWSMSIITINSPVIVKNRTPHEVPMAMADGLESLVLTSLVLRAVILCLEIVRSATRASIRCSISSCVMETLD